MPKKVVDDGWRPQERRDRADATATALQAFAGSEVQTFRDTIVLTVEQAEAISELLSRCPAPAR